VAQASSRASQQKVVKLEAAADSSAAAGVQVGGLEQLVVSNKSNCVQLILFTLDFYYWTPDTGRGHYWHQ